MCIGMLIESSVARQEVCLVGLMGERLRRR